ncbi:MAG: RDD family protein [Deltaproteobacteria bacterium]|nr:RDD family protein [Deltaproteobacteria bacterium]
MASMDRYDPADPYAPPGSDVNAGMAAGFGEAPPLAERGTRLLAVSIDSLILCIPVVPMLGIGAYVGWRTAAQYRNQPFPAEAIIMPQVEGMALFAGAMGIGFLCMLGIMVYQWVLISQTGQTIGKRATGIRIERIDGSPVNFGTGVVLRNWVMKLIGALPYLGVAIQIVDCLFIFREDRRCIHDHIAGTRVVRQQR